jgi:hypothetical protein
MNTKLSHIFRLILLALLLSGCNLPLPNANQPTPTPLGELRVTVTAVPATETPSPPAVSENDRCGNPYYPVVDGAQWSYKATTGDFTHTITIEDENTFTISAADSKNTFAIQGFCTDGDITLLNVPGVSLTGSGQGTGFSITTTSHEGVTLLGDIQQGDDWSQTLGVQIHSGNQNMDVTITSTYTADGYESVTVPAGTFQALKITLSSLSDGDANPTTQTLWYAAGVGLVKAQIDAAEPIVIELVSDNIP